MLEHKKRFTKKPAAAAPAKSAPAEPAKSVKTAKAEPAKKTAAPAPKPVEAPKVAAKPAAAPKVEAKTVVAPKVETKPATTPKVEAKPAAPKAAPKIATIKNNINSMPEETLAFFANLLLWISCAISLLVIIFGVIIALDLKGADSPVFLVCCIIAAVIMIIYPLIIWAIVRVFVNISKTLMKINAKLPEPKPEEK
ncbi:MAG: hypothetical protein K5651_02045 [Bacteroidales bacterium]|nr:hypothetical protein [Bacteroidales bacterium]